MLLQLSLAAVCMVALVVLLLWWPRKAATAAQTQTELFAERLHLLTLARDNGELAAEDFLTAANELKSQFLQQQSVAVKEQKTPLLAPLSLLLVLVVVATTMPSARRSSSWCSRTGSTSGSSSSPTRCSTPAGRPS